MLDLPRLPTAAEAYRNALPKGRVVGFPMHDLDRTGVKAWYVALFPDDPTAFPGSVPNGCGYGFDDETALIGAFGELAEGVLPVIRLSGEKKWSGSHQTLVRERGERGIVNPISLCLPAGSPVTESTPLVWIESKRWETDEPVLVPIDVVATSSSVLPAGYAPFATLVNNGQGAGPDFDWAFGHGILELLQRDGNGLCFRALDRGCVLDIEPDDLDNQTRALLDHLDRAGIEIIPKFVSDEFGLANVYVVGFDRNGQGPRTPVMLSACGEACDPDRATALRKALLEFCSARVRKSYAHSPLSEARRVSPDGFVEAFVERAATGFRNAEPRAFQTMRNWSSYSASELQEVLGPSVFSQRSSTPFRQLPQTVLPTSRERGRFAAKALQAAGFDILVFDGSPAGGAVAAARVIVPGLEVETMSYHRIGERNTRRLMESDSELVCFGDESETRRPIRLTPEAFERLGGRQPLLDTAAIEHTIGPLYPLYREPEALHVGWSLAQTSDPTAT